MYAIVWLPRLARANRRRRGGVRGGDVPARIERHTSAARFFHWVMAAAMIALLITGFFPIVGIQFPWVTIHWVAGVLLTISILYHIVHATFFLDFWSIWILPSDLQEAWQRVKNQMGQDAGAIRKHGKYPAGPQAVSPGGDHRRHRGDRHRPGHDAAHRQRALAAQSVPLQRPRRGG